MPGHGRFIHGKEFVSKEIELVDYVNEKVAELMKQGIDTDQILKNIDLFETKLCSNGFAGNEKTILF